LSFCPKHVFHINTVAVKFLIYEMCKRRRPLGSKNATRIIFMNHKGQFSTPQSHNITENCRLSISYSLKRFLVKITLISSWGRAHAAGFSLFVPERATQEVFALCLGARVKGYMRAEGRVTGPQGAQRFCYLAVKEQ
jgi:hypothetical protein